MAKKDAAKKTRAMCPYQSRLFLLGRAFSEHLRLHGRPMGPMEAAEQINKYQGEIPADHFDRFRRDALALLVAQEHCGRGHATLRQSPVLDGLDNAHPVGHWPSQDTVQ